MNAKIALSFVMAVTLLILVLYGYREDDLKITPSYKSSSMHGLHLIHKTGDKIKWELKAEGATMPENEDEIIINSLQLRIYNDYGVNLSAGSGSYKIDDKVLTINSPVEIDIKNARLMTDSLTWDGQNGLIRTDKMITFKGDNFYIEGTGLEVKIKEERVRILKDVKGTFYL